MCTIVLSPCHLYVVFCFGWPHSFPFLLSNQVVTFSFITFPIVSDSNGTTYFTAPQVKVMTSASWTDNDNNKHLPKTNKNSLRVESTTKTKIVYLISRHIISNHRHYNGYCFESCWVKVIAYNGSPKICLKLLLTYICISCVILWKKVKTFRSFVC